MSNEDKEKKMKGDESAESASTDRTPVSIEVRPVIEHKNQVICDILPAAHAKGEKLNLKNGKYKLEFNIIAGTPNDVTFETDDNGDCRAIFFDEDGCPKNENGTMPAGQVYKASRISDSQVVVEVDVSGDPYVLHYRLNFNDDRYFDPIIIHD